jgi:hypothetical protein
MEQNNYSSCRRIKLSALHDPWHRKRPQGDSKCQKIKIDLLRLPLGKTVRSRNVDVIFATIKETLGTVRGKLQKIDGIGRHTTRSKSTRTFSGQTQEDK